MVSDFVAFLGVSILVIVTPGPDTALVIRNTLRGGRSNGVFTACSLTLMWLTGYSLALVRAGDVLLRPRIRRTLDGLAGAALVTFGLRLATEHR